MKIFLIFLTVCALTSAQDQGQTKLQKIRKLEESSPGGIITFTDKTYAELVLQNPRPYDVVMLYTVAAHCDQCDEVMVEYQSAVYSYLQDRELTGKQVFFGVLYHSQTTQSHFILHKFKTVPYIAVSQQKQKRLDTEEFLREEDKWLVRADQVYEAQVILDFINKKFNTNVSLVFPLSTILFKNLIFLAIVIGLVSILKYIRLVLLEPAIWFLIAMAVFVICTGGIVYSIIHGVPWFKFDRDQLGNLYVSEYFMKGQRGQWAGEGYIFSFLVTFTGLIWIFLVSIETFVKRNFHKRVAVIVSILVIFFAMQLILMIYRIKSPWYGPTFFPPGHYERGPLSRDQGNNI